MVLCILALPIFAVLAIFSVKYRKLTRDSLYCLFRTATLRKCETGLDDKIKSVLTGKILRFSPKGAELVYRHYTIISWLVLALFIWSAVSSGVGIYNYINYGNCNGPESTGFCMLDPTGADSKITEIDTVYSGEIVYPELEEDDPTRGPENAELTIIQFGCYICPYTKKSEQTVWEVIDYYKGRVNFQFKTFIIPYHDLSRNSAIAANCALEQGKYEEYHKLMFERQEKINSEEDMLNVIKGIGLNQKEFDKCYEGVESREEVDKDSDSGIKAGVPGTPTFFIGEKKIIGPKPFKTFKKLIDEALE